LIVLIGFMGAGKTTVGRRVAKRLGLPFVDSDSVIEEREQRTVRDIFASDGEAVFRRIERATVLDLLDGPDAVLALGGGAVQDPVIRAAVARATTVHLVVTPEQVRARVGSDAGRPLLAGADLAQLLERRRPHYDEAATIHVPTDGRPVAAVVDDVLARLASQQ
jgi:shikimate kinase